jgi:hypothetical protein
VGAARCTPAFMGEVIGRIREGASLNSLSREPGAPGRATLRRWLAARPEFAAAVAQACQDREDWHHDQILTLAESAPAGAVPAARRRIGALRRQLVRLRHRPGAR